MTTTRADVVVVGGGPVGVLTGVLLAAAGVDVVVLERRTAPPTLSRAIGVHPPSLDLLDRVGAAEPLLAGSVLVRRGVARSRGRVLGTLSFDRVSRTHPYVATSPQDRTEAVLRARLDELAPGSLRRGVTVTGVVPAGDRVHVTASGGAAGHDDVHLDAAFVVAADGARSTVRELLGVRTTRRRYPDHYVMGDFADPDPRPDASTHEDDRDAVVDVGPDGVVESFPLSGHRRRFVVRTDDSRVGADDVAALVAGRTGTIPDPASCTMLSAFDVGRRFAERMVHGRVVLIGDAAHEISPIGGQGMNLGWLDAGALASVLADALRVRPGGTPPEAALARFDAVRMRRARMAARQAEWNMAAGRPATGVGLAVRDSFFRAVLVPPVGGVLAAVYAMRFA